MDEVSDFERKILEFERQWWKHRGAKEEEIRRQFGISGTRYYQVLNALIDTARAETYEPMLIKRLRRLRDHRRHRSHVG